MYFQTDYIVAIVLCICFVSFFVYVYKNGKENERKGQEEKNKKSEKK